MPRIDTLIEFLETSGLAPRYYDMGRRILPLSREAMLRFERCETPYPQPLQQQAWLALVLRSADNPADPLIWFIRFPLDEQGKLLLAARDDFMFQLMEGVGKSALQGDDQRAQIESTLARNPYVYQPKQEQLAAFHARLTVDLQQPPSRFYAHAQRYFSGELGWDQWSFIGLQGIADIAARHAEEDNERRLAAAIPHLPATPLEALCQALEHEPVPASIGEALLARAGTALQTTDADPRLIAALLRGISFCTSPTPRKAMLAQVLDHSVARHASVLAAVAGRLWLELNSADLRERFLERLAANDRGQPLFDQILGDLLYLEACRPGLLKSLRDPHRSPRLSQAIGAFFKQIPEP
jgi:hypothetical protein